MSLVIAVLISDVALSVFWAFCLYQHKRYKYEQQNEYEHYLNQMKQEMKNFTECKDKQIDNIYEILEFFTNESKRKNLNESNSNVSEKKE